MNNNKTSESRIPLETQSFPIALVVSRFNESITEKLKEGALARLRELHFKEEDIRVISVPGAVEIPLATKCLAKNGNYLAIICLGAVIRGETPHFDYVCEQVSLGIQQVMLDYEIPIAFGVLTTDTEKQALDRVGGVHGHKGVEAVDTAIEMVHILEQIEEEGCYHDE